MIICSMGRERKLLIGHLKDEVCIAYRSYYKRAFLVWNKNRRKAIFNWAAEGAIFSEGRGRLYTLRLP